MQHSFDILIAEKFGVNVAIFLNNLAFWIKKNHANDKHFYKDRYWTYNSSKALSEIFPYWSEDQIDRLIKKCTDEDLIILDNFNKTKWEKTRWFSLTDKSIVLLNVYLPRNRGVDSSNSFSPSREIAVSYNETDINTDINTDIEATQNESVDKSKKKRKKPAIRIPDGYTYNDTHKIIAKEENTDVDKQLAIFKDHALERDRICSDWDAAFRKWLRKVNEFAKPSFKTQYKPVETRSTLIDLPTLTTEEKIARDKKSQQECFKNKSWRDEYVDAGVNKINANL